MRPAEKGKEGIRVVGGHMNQNRIGHGKERSEIIGGVSWVTETGGEGNIQKRKPCGNRKVKKKFRGLSLGFGQGR